MENFLLSNLGLLFSWSILTLLIPIILDSLGASGNADILLSAEFLSKDGLLLILTANCAAFIGSLPSWLGISKDEGLVLS